MSSGALDPGAVPGGPDRADDHVVPDVTGQHVVSVALGSVQADPHAGVTYRQWVVSACALTFAAAMLAFGMVGDEFGCKRVMLIGLGAFCAESVMCEVLGP